MDIGQEAKKCFVILTKKYPKLRLSIGRKYSRQEYVWHSASHSQKKLLLYAFLALDKV
jgi:hypothetical protein